MNRLKKLYAIVLLAGVILNGSYVFAQTPQAKASQQPQGASTPVAGSGTPGQVAKWTGLSGENTFSIGDSIITETKFGLIGIGTTTPSSKLSVFGAIESLNGGFRFPDGTVQTTAGLSSIFRDATLIGNGTAASPLGIAPGGVGTLQLGNSAVTAQKIANGSVVRSFNGLFDNIQLTGGANITITPSGNTLTIAAPDVLTSISHDATLAGNGTSGSLLGIANGGVGATQLANNAVSTVKLATGAVTAPKLNTVTSPAAGQFLGFDGSNLAWQTLSGSSAVATDATLAGDGTTGSPLRVAVPLNLTGTSGSILSAASVNGGRAVIASANDDNASNGGVGVQAFGGTGGVADVDGSVGNGGTAVLAFAGNGIGAGKRSGEGIFAFGGSGLAGAADGLAGHFQGNVAINGSLNVSGTKNFKIDHPLDPENKYLYHAAIESSEVLNVYSGNVTTDASGEAAVTLPDWFESINRDFRYQLTVVGQFAQAIVGNRIRHNRFTVRTSTPNVDVSWQVTGVRSDEAMLKHPFKVEEDKDAVERGHYLVPEAFDQPEEKSVVWARHPELMKQLKEKREQIKQSRSEK